VPYCQKFFGDFAHWDIVYNDRIIDRNNRYNDRKPKSEPRDLKKLFLTTYGITLIF